MKPAPEELTTWIDLIRKLLLSVVLVIAIIGYGYKGYLFLAAKQQQESSEARASTLLAETYAELLSNLNEEISELDKSLDDELWKDSIGWERNTAIRELKVRDRNELLRVLGAQIVQIEDDDK